MQPLEEMQDRILDELADLDSKTIFEIFYLVIKSQGERYEPYRRRWMEMEEKQLSLFNELK